MAEKTTKLSEKETRMPPQNVEAEQSVLGSLLLDKEAMIKIADIITSSDFYREDHRIIYEAMITLFDKRAPIDVLTLTEELEKKKKLKEVGGASYLTNLVNSVPSAAHVVHYAQIVANKATLRRLISTASEILEMGYENEDAGVEKVLDMAESKLFSVSKEHTANKFITLRDALEESFDRVDMLHKNKGALRGLTTSFKDLDNILAGLQKSDLIILAARPSMGKTSLALNIALNIATNEKIPVGIFSLEMSKDQLVDRLIVSQARIDSWKMRTGNLGENDFAKIGTAMGILSEAPVFIEDTPNLSVMEIRTKARRLQAEHGVGLIVIDYLQLMEGRYYGGGEINRVQEISDISRGLKALARELEVPVLALSQLSRAVEQRHPQIPQLSDLRESGSIEQDADVVMFIYREDYYDSETERKNIADILIKKHRNGPTGDIELYFAETELSFRNLESKREEQSISEDSGSVFDEPIEVK